MGFEKVLYFSKKMLDRWCATVLSHVWQICQRGKVCAARGNTNPITPIRKVPIGAFKIDKPNAYLGEGSEPPANPGNPFPNGHYSR